MTEKTDVPDKFDSFPMSAAFLPGTVALPPPFTTVGEVWIPSPEFRKRHGIVNTTDLLAIRKLFPPTKSIVRFVRVEHLSAIFVPERDRKESGVFTSWDEGIWLYAPVLNDLKKRKWDKAPGWAIVFVPENAPVMTQEVYGATAAVSAEFGGDRRAFGGFGGCDKPCCGP